MIRPTTCAITFVNGLLILALLGCGTDERDFQQALAADTLKAYDEFLAHHPQSVHAAEVDRRSLELRWKEVETANTTHEYERFLQSHPDERYAVMARQGIEAIDWQTAVGISSYEGYATFLRKHSAGQRSQDARARLMPLALQRRDRVIAALKRIPAPSTSSGASVPTGIEMIPVPRESHLLAAQESLFPGRLPASQAKSGVYLVYSYRRGTTIVRPTGAAIGGRDPTQELIVSAEILFPDSGSDPMKVALRSGLAGEGCDDYGCLVSRAVEQLQLSPEYSEMLAATVGLATGLNVPANLPDDAKAAVLRQSLGDSPYWADRMRAAQLLGGLGDKAAVPLLVDACDDANLGVQEAAVRALGQVRDERATDKLLNLLQESSRPMRVVPTEVVEALGQSADRRALEPLLDCLGGTLSCAVEETVGALDRIDADWRQSEVARRAALTWAPLLSAGDPSVRITGLHLLAEVRYGRAFELVTDATKDRDASVRRDAARALGRFNDPRAFEPLAAAARDSDWQVRDEALRSLGALGDGRADDVLINAMKDPSSEVRLTAASALGKRTGTRAIEPLIAALADTDSEVRRYSGYALEKLTSQHFGADQEAWRSWWNRQR